MRTLVIAVVVGLVGSSLVAAPPVLKTENDKVSYTIGQDIGRNVQSVLKNLKKNGVEIDQQIITQGILDAITGAKSALTEDEQKAVMAAFQKEMAASAPKRMAEVAARNKKDGEAFLAENGKKEGIVTTKSGLQYKVLKEGKGAMPKGTDTVKTHYHGTLLDGSVFDSSVERGEPATFQVNEVIKGWTEALQLMKVGSKVQIFVPAELGYGERGAGADIGPNCTLIFEVELLGIESAEDLPKLPKLIDKN